MSLLERTTSFQDNTREMTSDSSSINPITAIVSPPPPIDDNRPAGSSSSLTGVAHGRIMRTDSGGVRRRSKKQRPRSGPSTPSSAVPPPSTLGLAPQIPTSGSLVDHNIDVNVLRTEKEQEQGGYSSGKSNKPENDDENNG